jgi:hypothetical protein
MKTRVLSIAAMAVATTLSFGEEGQKPKGPGKGKRPNAERIFKRLDTNGDGSLSLEEFKAGPRAQKNPEKAEQIFAKMDSDSSGGVSLEEFKNFRPPHPPRKGGGKGKGGDAPQAPTE